MNAAVTAFCVSDASALWDAAIFAALAWGISRDSRFAAVSDLDRYLLERVLFVMETGPSKMDLVLALALTIAFIHGVRGTFALRRLRGRTDTAQATLTGQPLFR
jgi:hypothetical protein